MDLIGLSQISRERLPNGVTRYILEGDPDLATVGRRKRPDWPHLYTTVAKGLMIRNLANIRRDLPYLFLLTNDIPREARMETHLQGVGGGYDQDFMNRFSHTTVHVDLGPYEDTSFLAGPTTYSRLFDVGREDITYLWDGLVNGYAGFIAYHLLFASRRVPLETVSSLIDRCTSRRDFESVVLDSLDVLAFVYELTSLHVHAKRASVVARIDGALEAMSETHAQLARARTQ